MEQHEIEFMPVPLEEAADQLIIARWMLRMIGLRHGITITFAPKILVGHAGSGMHFHTRLMKDGENMMVKGNRISDTARKAIAGYLALAPSLTAFGNTVPVSYLRLVPHQEAPTNICWGERNRSVLVRVPLGWLNVQDMVKDANPQEKGKMSDFVNPQTVEYRGSDGSADVYLTLAALAVAARHGMEMEKALEMAESLYVNVNIFAPEHKSIREKLAQLPRSCWESAEQLLAKRGEYEKYGVFPPRVIDDMVKKLKDYNDINLSEHLSGKEDETRRQVEKYIHCA
jgi:glutamine synthetase